MENFNLYNLDLKYPGENYASFSGYILSSTEITPNQLNIIVKFLSINSQSQEIKSFDSEGESLEDYCSEFNFFDLEDLEDSCVVILDLNVIEEGDTDADLTEVFLSDDNGYLLIFKPNGETSIKII
jgi:hypothetical protein